MAPQGNVFCAPVIHAAHIKHDVMVERFVKHVAATIEVRNNASGPHGAWSKIPIACNYDIAPVDHPSPAQRIHALEESLVRAKYHIEDLQRQLAEDIAGDSQCKTSSQKAVVASRVEQTPAEVRYGTARSTGLDLIDALLRPLSHHDDIRNLTNWKGSSEFLRKSPSKTKPFFTELCQLPVHATMISTVCAAFEGVFGLCNIVVEQDFHSAAQALYDSHPMSYTQEHVNFMPLFYSVIALGMIHRTDSRQKAEPEIELEQRQVLGMKDCYAFLTNSHLPASSILLLLQPPSISLKSVPRYQPYELVSVWSFTLSILPNQTWHVVTFAQSLHPRLCRISCTTGKEMDPRRNLIIF